ncbi:hypothetical protein QJS10_CPB17g00053 [Acorus calamus]|uniref:Uncharacterized protein n=1 Tax=Acorus calamus TaxID=4465 RepID=A0AAV9CSS1_ACOCL|nr:hypothetical protein QJS10_CPB17g00053 [Acorus calamus]
MAATRDHDHNTTLFEFYSDSTSEMCAAEDIFLRGRLLPYRPPQTTEEEPPKPTAHHGKTESFDESNRGCAKGRFLKGGSSSSSSLEYRKLQRARSERPPPPASAAKPNWYWIVFGSVKLPGEMEMRDIRSRQRRRQPPPPLSSEGRKAASVKSGSGWRLLKSLSCKGHDDDIFNAVIV